MLLASKWLIAGTRISFSDKTDVPQPTSNILGHLLTLKMRAWVHTGSMFFAEGAQIIINLHSGQIQQTTN